MKIWRMSLAGAALFGITTPVVAKETLTYGLYGTPGLIEMPTAQSAPDGELAFTFSYGAKSLRSTMTFQLTPRLSTTFRYTQVTDWTADPTSRYYNAYYDRSFDLRYRLVDEGRIRPAIAIGLQDFIGTGLYSGEYIVATKTFAEGKVQASAGIGWGRLGAHNSFSNPFGVISDKFDTRNTGFTGTGGQVESAKWFRGPAAAFGGLSWKATDRLTAKVEYSSDNVRYQTDSGNTLRSSPFNYGLDYKMGKRSHLSAYYLYGSDFGLGLTFTTDPKSSPTGGTHEGAPIPVLTRPAGAANDLGWAQGADQTRDVLVKGLAPLMAKEGLVLEGMELSGRTATIRVRNTRYSANAQAVGRTARIVSNVLPPSVEEIRIILMKKGIPTSQVILPRSGLERFENDLNGSDQMLAATRFEDAAQVDRRAGLNTDLYPKFNWRLGPYAKASLFDPDNPVRVDAGLELAAEWNPTPGLYVSGAMRKRVLGNLDTSTRASNSVLPHVRSDANVYDAEGDPSLEYLTAAYFFRPGKDLYGRVTAGYLERMYGGVSAEVLWKPVGSRLAFGAEINAVKQRSYDDMFGFVPKTIDGNANPILQPLSTYADREYSTVTGHLSAYYQFGNGFHGQLDVGRYLAGDWGATVTLDREFNNGWVVGAYATITDVSADEFGEGSFDKGIRVVIPVDWQLGTPTRKKSTTVLQPLTRDGGARLNVQDRLYELTRDAHQPQLEARWGRFWK